MGASSGSTRRDAWPRPLRAETYWLDVARIRERVLGKLGHSRSLRPERLREAMATTLAVVGRATGWAGFDLTAPWAETVAFQPERVARDAGLSLGAVRAASQMLASAGIWSRVDYEDALRVQFDRSAFVASPVAESLDWPALLDRLRGNTTALLTFWALLEQATYPFDAAIEASRPRLMEVAAYSAPRIKAGLDALVEAGVIERQRRAGMADLLTIAPWVRGETVQPAESVPAETVPVAVPEPIPHPGIRLQAGSVPAPATEAARPVMRARIGDIEIEVEGGITIRIERDALGRETYRIGRLVIGPLDPDPT